MDKYIITKEEQETVKLCTARSLPDSPSERGMPPLSIKTFFWKFLEPLFKALNAHLGQIEGGIVGAISEHDASEIAHEYILNLIRDLQEQNTELGTTITEHYSRVEQAISNLSGEIDSDLSKHDNDANAHKQIQFDMADIKRIAQDALNFATGKSKIIPVKDVFEMTTRLNAYLNVGDKFVLSDKNVPDFTLFEKESTSENATEFSQTDLLFGNVEFLPGESYLYNGYLLVASESGIDTSSFAKASDLGGVKDRCSELEDNVEQMTSQLLEKEDKMLVRAETAEAVTLNNDTEYNLGIRTSIILNLPSEMPTDYECIVNFHSGAYATTFDSPDSIIFTQDDCLEGKLYPISNRLYEINIKNVGGNLIAKVGAVDYEIL